jgi:pyrophosphate--fructose-6-phosphate 1-phosphotransferase
MSDQISPLEEARLGYAPKLPKVFAEHGTAVALSEGGPTQSVADQAEIKELFPHTYGLPIVTFTGAGTAPAGSINVGVILSGGQAPGGHNVITGLYDGLKKLNPENQLYGFLGGPSGLIDNDHICFGDNFIDRYRNTGGFDIIGSGRTKLEAEDQFAKVAENCKALRISAVVVIGGDDSNTNACIMAEYMLKNDTGIQVIGCPKTIDGDLKNEWIEASFGFDTATKVYSGLIGNILRDSNSAKKYYHFIKLMGRSASHIALECALKTHPNHAIISEEVAQKKLTLREIVAEIAGIIRDRAAARKNYGVVLIPEGLIEFVPEVKLLIGELNELLSQEAAQFDSLDIEGKIDFVKSKLQGAAAEAFGSLPHDIQQQFLMDRDPHGNVQVSRISTEKLLIEMVEAQLKAWQAEGAYDGKFDALNHFFGYEGRCAAPSNFDADYCYSLGFTAAALVASGKTGYISSVRNLTKPADQWVPGGIPLTMMMNLERRHGKHKPVIRKALVELDQKPFRELSTHRMAWAMDDEFVYPGPIQYYGPSQVCDLPTVTMQLEHA